MAGTIISGVILGIVALIMLCLGISQLNSKTPVSFYTGEKPPDENQLTDMKAWNKKHGFMWIIYGCCIIASWICGLIIGDNILFLIPFTVGVGLPIIIMILYHNKLIKRYMK